jgi:asparagine synthase (glutamine-hydrolysing)
VCGIAGIWFNKKEDNSEEQLRLMTNAILHRGPDGEGSWISSDRKIALGHRRLAIIDLSIGGAQPMHYLDRYVITFNGEIYNYIEIRIKLQAKGYVFRSESDTEVILAAYNEWGINCLNEFDGMFALALYDKHKEQLLCVRDRFGEKPFYYSVHNGNLYFGSEMKALWAAGVPKKTNKSMFYNFLANDLVENPNDQQDTFYEGIYKLKSAHYFVISGDLIPEQRQYWKLNTTTSTDLSMRDASARLQELLQTSVERRLRSDVPVGTSLSGGLDSSTIVSLVSEFSSNNHTFSARFPGFVKDEGRYIDMVQQHFKTDHHNVIVDENELLGEFEKLLYHQEEPFQTGSIFAQYCVYREARKNNIIVMLDGQGADEMLGGYDKDFKFYLRELIRSGKNSSKFMQQIKENHNYTLSVDPKENFKIKAPLAYKTLAALKQKISSEIPEGINRNFHREFAPKRSPFHEFNDLKSMLHYELTNQGLEKLLKFADRNSMAHSLEVRLPFLNHELVEFIFSLKSELFLKEGWSKAILRESVKEKLPKEIVYRKDKIGFEAPHEQWMKNTELYNMFSQSKEFLMKEKIITENYSNHWKLIIAAKYLQF